MKFLLSFFLFLFVLTANATPVLTPSMGQFSIEITSEAYDKGKKRNRAQRKKARRGQKMRNKRKRACKKWGGRSYAG